MIVRHLKKGEIYKVCHHDIQIGYHYDKFDALSNCIIFSPLIDMEIFDIIHIPCVFLITFSRSILIYGEDGFIGEPPSTMFLRDCTFEMVTNEDYDLLANLINGRYGNNKIPYFLSKTNYRYNRKLRHIVKI